MSVIDSIAETLLSKLGVEGIDIGTVKSALSGLMGNDQGELDIASIITQLKGSGLSSMLGSWLGDGENESISLTQVTELFGSDKIQSFASQLGIEPTKAAEGLASVVPDMIDANSNGGDLLESLGGSDLLKKATSFF